MNAEPLEILRTVFGHPAFRGDQAEIIDHVVAGGDALVLMPTGGGKSLCYQIPALCRPGVAVVVSPLIALMQDQVTALRQLGVRAAAINSSLAFAEVVEVERQMRQGEVDLVYVAPERLLTDPFLNHLDRCDLALFAIDEAHCVSQWGHDFRPEYRQLIRLHERWPAVPRIALTATADRPTRQDILERLALEQGRVFVSGFDRPNIRYRVAPKTEVRRQLKQFLAGHAGESGIVYCLSRARVEDIAEWLKGQGVDAMAYHAGLDKSVRAANQARFLAEDGVVMVATIAFGMGIDKPDVRFVVHLDLPKSLEAYYQETGRAGRDGLPAEVWMAYGIQDVAKLRQLIDASDAAEDQKWIERRKLEALLGYCETTRCRRQVLLEYFGDTGAACGNCDTCLEPVDSFDGTVAAQKIMSCIYRTGQIFGAGHVIDVLVGADTENIRRRRHQELSTHGVGKEFSRDEWRSILRQLVALGLVEVDVAGHGSLRLGADCRPVLRGEQRVSLRREQARRRPRTTAARERPVFDSAADEALYKALRARRYELSREQNLAPYMIFHDTTLVDMVRQRPRNTGAFARLDGVGAVKLERYADVFLAVIAEHEAADDG